MQIFPSMPVVLMAENSGSLQTYGRNDIAKFLAKHRPTQNTLEEILGKLTERNIMSVDLKGFDELRHRVEGIKRKGEAGVRLNELFHLDFMNKYTNFGSIDEMAEASGIEIKSMEDFNKISGGLFQKAYSIL